MGKSGGCQGQMRSQCSLILPASFISQCRLGGLVGYAVLYPSAAPEERRLDPARGAWSVFMQMAAVEWSRADSSTSPILHTKGHSTTDKQQAAPLFSSQGLFLLPEPGIYPIGYFLTLNPNIWRMFVSKQTGKIRSKGPTLCAISSKWTEECL